MLNYLCHYKDTLGIRPLLLLLCVGLLCQPMACDVRHSIFLFRSAKREVLVRAASVNAAPLRVRTNTKEPTTLLYDTT